MAGMEVTLVINGMPLTLPPISQLTMHALHQDGKFTVSKFNFYVSSCTKETIII